MNDQKWKMNRLDNRELSILRRFAGTTGRDIASLCAFYKACENGDPYLEEYWFPMICMDALWQKYPKPLIRPMEECLHILLASEAEIVDIMQRRIDMLLETRWDEDGFLLSKLFHLVKIVKAKTFLKPDFQALADDLSSWNDTKQLVQRRWLRTLYSVKPTISIQGEQTK